jgi:hypothetical protein
MPDGRVLGDWTGDELVKLSVDETALAEGHKKNAAFFAAVASQVPNNKTVRDGVPAKRVEELWAKVYGK